MISSPPVGSDLLGSALGAVSLPVERQKCKPDRSPLSGVDVKHESICTSTTFNVFMACTRCTLVTVTVVL
jgi:hypothetical protein